MIRNALIMLNNLLHIKLKLHQKNYPKNSRSDQWFDWKKIADKITRVSKTSPNNNLDTIAEIRTKLYIYRVKTKNYWWSKIKERKLLVI